ncbi:tetratricopeptide repeat protein [Aerosakkonema sp. BLCC-F183]|uniref:tetratricopeptide repeat protein n=1 Tax=Aerosakkonema sp. BLCC-F183 TaxID=3342834 RepID=UPI0035BA0794
MQTLHQELQKSDRVVISAVAGMGGVGKTELAIKYAREHDKDYAGGICWLTARDESLAPNILLFAQLYLKLEVPQEFGGKPLTLKEQVNWCWQNWQPPEESVLLVLDDVTNWKSCRDFLPKINRFRILITTRLRNLDSNFVELPLDILSADEALELLTALVGKKRVDRELQTATELCKWLGYLPLGLELVGRYLLEDPDLSLAEMWEKLKKKRLEDEAINLSDEQLQDTEMTAKRGVKAALELSWQELDLMAQNVGELLSLFAPDIIPWELVKSVTELLNWGESEVNEGKKQLYKRHLIQRVEERDACYEIHPLIREFLQAKLAVLEQANNLKQAFVQIIVKISQEIPESPTLDLIESLKVKIPHLAEVAQNLTNVLSDEDLIWPFVGLGRFYNGQGFYALAEPWQKQCLAVVKAKLGEFHPDVAQSLNNLANLYYSQGRYQEAEPLYQEALAMRKRLLGEFHPNVAQSLNDLALLYNSQGRYQEAEPLYQEALAMYKRLLGEFHPYVATSLNNLAYLYYSQGRYQEAEPLLQEELQIREQVLGVNHPQTVTIRQNLATLQSKMKSSSS